MGLSSNAGALLQVRGLSVCYESGGKVVHALKQVDLDVHAGEILGLLGESGSGKSTLAAAILGLLPAQASRVDGQIRFQGRELSGMAGREMRAVRGSQISLIWQDPALALNPVLGIGTQIGEVLRAHSELSVRQRRTRVLELLREVGFAEAEQIYGAYPHQLSGGQRQRAVIAQAIACQPTLIIADEATSKLDSVLGNDILGVLIAMCRRAGSAILLISHDAGVLAAISDRIAVMYAGHIVEEADTSMLFTCPKHPYTQALVQLAAMSFNAGKRRLPVISGEIPDLAEFGAGCCFEPRCDQKLAICASRQPVQIQSGNGRVSCLKYVEHS